MAMNRIKIAGQVRSELEATISELPDELLYAYTNLVQKEVVQMLGPVVDTLFRKRIVLGSFDTGPKINDGAGTYTNTSKVITGFTALTVSAHVNDEVVFYGTVSSNTVAYKDIITANDATTITIKGNSLVGANGTGVTAIIIAAPSGSLAGTDLSIPDDCMRPLYISDLTDPTQESRIDFIQVDDTEQYIENTYWGSEVGTAVHLGNKIYTLKGSSASYPTQAVLTYVSRPSDFTTDTDQMLVSERRLPEEYFGIMRAGILKLSAQHLRRRDDMNLAGEDMTQRISAIRQSWGMTQAITKEEDKTK